MCLSTIEERFDPPVAKVKTGWKVFCEYDGVINTYKTILKETLVHYLAKKWHQDKNWGAINTWEDGMYQKGYHIFRTREGARYYKKLAESHGHENIKVVKVEYKDVVASGTERFIDDCAKVISYDVDVAKRIKILNKKV